MAKKVIVEISEDMYSKICDYDGRHDVLINRGDLYTAIKNGAPLESGHGKIVDANRVLENGDNWEVETALMQTEAIIEADTTYNPCDTNPFGDDRFGG